MIANRDAIKDFVNYFSYIRSRNVSQSTFYDNIRLLLSYWTPIAVKFTHENCNTCDDRYKCLFEDRKLVNKQCTMIAVFDIHYSRTTTNHLRILKNELYYSGIEYRIIPTTRKDVDNSWRNIIHRELGCKIY